MMLAVLSPPQIVQSPDWKLLIVLYFFLGGIAAGAYFFSCLIELFGGSEVRDRDIAHAGYLIAFPLVVICGILLTLDLGRPDRFWHMLIDSNTGYPLLRWQSPMSVGAWGLLIFGLFTFLSFVATLAEIGWIRLGVTRAIAAVLQNRAIHILFTFAGSIAGFFLAGYTGVLLSVSNQPIWSDTHLLGGLFLASAASTGIAALVLSLVLRGGAAVDALDRLDRADAFALVVELLLLAAFLLTVGAAGRSLYAGRFAPWLYIGVVLVGLLLPLALRLRSHALGVYGPALAAALVLVGGFVLRAIIVLAPQV
jgi:protein NrfD